MMDAERRRLSEAEAQRKEKPWYRWVPYLASVNGGRCARITRPLARRGILSA